MGSDPPARKPTLRTIARAAGVTHGVVSAVLANRPSPGTRFSEATRERVRRIARELNYRPNAAARAIRARQFHTIGVVAPKHFASQEAVLHVLDLRLLEGVNDALIERDYCLSLLRVSWLPGPQDLQRWPRLLAESRVDGLLVLSNVPTELQGFAVGCRLPAIWVNTNLHEPRDCIWYDDAASARAAVRHLAERGHRRIAFLKSATERHYSARERHRGYLEAMAELGLSPYPGHDRLITDYDFVSYVRALLAQPDPPTAIVPVYGVLDRLHGAIAQAGRQVPRDVSTLSWMDSPRDASMTVPPATAMVLDTYEVGRRAVEMLCRKIADPSAVVPSQVMTWALCPGESVAEPPIARPAKPWQARGAVP